MNEKTKEELLEEQSYLSSHIRELEQQVLQLKKDKLENDKIWKDRFDAFKKSTDDENSKHIKSIKEQLESNFDSKTKQLQEQYSKLVVEHNKQSKGLEETLVLLSNTITQLECQIKTTHTLFDYIVKQLNIKEK